MENETKIYLLEVSISSTEYTVLTRMRLSSYLAHTAKIKKADNYSCIFPKHVVQCMSCLCGFHEVQPHEVAF